MSVKRTTTSEMNQAAQIDRLQQAIEQADGIVIGAGAGLSLSAGLAYTGEDFEQNFSDFIEKYQFTDMYTAGFYPFASLEEHWAYWSRHIFYHRYDTMPGGVYLDLLQLVKDKDYFVITTNVDHQFQLAGFAQNRLFCTQGDYGLWQCSVPCHVKTYPNEKTVRQMVAKQQNMLVPSDLIPYCPKCGKPMSMHLRCDSTFVQDEAWHKASRRYQDFLHKYEGQHILFWELGVGWNTPSIIKYPFWRMTAQNPDAIYAAIHLEEAHCPPEINQQTIEIVADIHAVITSIRTK